MKHLGWFLSPETGGLGGSPTPSDGQVPDDQQGAGTQPVGGQDAAEYLARIAELEGAVRQREQDLNKTKSALQSSAAKREKELLQALELAHKEAEQLKLRSMTPEERDLYQKQQSVSQKEGEVERLRAQVNDITVKQQWLSYFAEKGVPPDKLLDGFAEMTSQDVFTRGMELIEAKLKPQPADQSAAPQGQGVQQSPPNVMTNQKGMGYPATTMTDLVKQYGTEDAVFRAAENGELHPDVLLRIFNK